jgi:ABC-type amino acid transport substrate-binding protein
MLFDLDGEPVDKTDQRPVYSERFIHSEMYKARPDVNSVVHSHSPTVVPFTVTNVPLKPIRAAFFYPEVPLFDTRDTAGWTNLLISDRKLGKALAEKLGVPVAFVAFGSSGELANAAEAGAWDVAFMPVDDERRQKLAFGPDYVLFQSTYLVPPGSPIQRFEEVDRPGVRVFGVENTTTARSAARALKQATLTNVKSGDDIYEAARSGKADAVALGRRRPLLLRALNDLYREAA